MATTSRGVGLSFTELWVRDWSRSLTWYRDVLGLRMTVMDDERQFVLFEGPSGGLALKYVKDNPVASGVRLVFRVDDIEDARRRLAARGQSVSEILENTREGYREIRLYDPEGTSLTLFAWTGKNEESRREDGIGDSID